MTEIEIDDITQQLIRSAAHALRGARLAVDRHRQRTGRQRDEARRDREHRLRLFETQLRTTVLQRRLATKEGNDQLAAELTSIERDHRTDDLVARWAAAEAHRAHDPELADAWTARLREAGINPQRARAHADELMGEPVDYTDMSKEQQLATDYTDMASDFADQRAQAIGDPTHPAQLDDGAETARLIGLAHPADHRVSPVSAATQIPPASPHPTVDLDRVPQL